MCSCLCLAFLLVCGSVALLSLADTVQGDNFCSELMCATAFVNSSTVTYQLDALNQLGWMSIGFGTHMTNAKMIIMWPNTDGSVTLSQRIAIGLVEPEPDPRPGRTATIYGPLTKLSPSAVQSLAFTVPKDNATIQEAVWAFGIVNPMSTSPNATLEFHLDAGNFTLNLSKQIELGDIPALISSSSVNVPMATSTSTPSPSPNGQSSNEDDQHLAPFEKLIIAHAILSITGFLILLPVGALIARWARTFSDKWFYCHWTIQVIFGIPVVVIGWALGLLSISVQGGTHSDDPHKVLGILLLPLYLIQLSLGTLIRSWKPTYPKRHPPRNIVHGLLGILLICLAFYQARTGFTVDWTAATSRSYNFNLFSNLWIAWTVFIPVVYLIGFLLLPMQLARERELPPPYSLNDSQGEDRSERGVRRLLGLEPGPEDDGTHDVFSGTATLPDGVGGETHGNVPSEVIEMREVRTESSPLSLAASLSVASRYSM